MYIGLTSCPHHASGNVGDQLITESSIKLINEEHGDTDIDIYYRKEDLTSRLSKINKADAILLFPFVITKNNVVPEMFRIAENLEDVKPPIIPFSSSFTLFPSSKNLINSQTLNKSTTDFIDKIISNCPNQKLPARTKWVKTVLENNGYKSQLIGDPGWYDPEYIGKKFHKPSKINQLVFTPPHRKLYTDQAKKLLKKLSKKFPNAEKIISFQSALNNSDREIRDYSEKYDWKTKYTSHDVSNLNFYKDSDLHIGYRKHGHLAHLRWRRPSIILAEDSRSMGLIKTFETAGITAQKPRYLTNKFSTFRKLYKTKPIRALNLVMKQTPFNKILPPQGGIIAKTNHNAIPYVFKYIEKQKKNNWESYKKIRKKIDKTYKTKMKPFIKNLPKNNNK